MRAKYICVVLVVVSVLVLATADTEQLDTGKLYKHRLEDKVQEVSDLDDTAARQRKNRAKERQKKAQAAVTFMEKYKAAKVNYAREQARLRNRIANDKMYLMNKNPAMYAAHERGKKHDSRVKEEMKRAIVMTKKVEGLVNGKQKSDPTIKNAQKAVAKARGTEIYSVLGLDKAQIGKSYLMKMDAAVAAYDAKPSLQAHKKLEHALKNAKERMKKDQKLEREKKSEKRAKKERGVKNQEYFKVKWVEKRREIKRKHIKRARFVAKLKKENKHKAWVRRKNEDELEAKTGKKNQEVANKKGRTRSAQELQSKKVHGKFKIHKNLKAKLNKKLKILQDIATSKKSNARKKSIEFSRAKEQVSKAKAGMERKAKAVSVSSKQEKAAAIAYGQSKEKKGKQPSELNIKTANKALFYMRAKANTSRATKYKEKASKATMKEREKKKATAGLARKAAMSAKTSAIKKAANYKVVVQIKLNNQKGETAKKSRA